MKKYQKAKIDIVNLVQSTAIAGVLEDWLIANGRDMSEVTDAESYMGNNS